MLGLASLPPLQSQDSYYLLLHIQMHHKWNGHGTQMVRYHEDGQNGVPTHGSLCDVESHSVSQHDGTLDGP